MTNPICTATDKLLLAAIDCTHTITAEQVVLQFDPSAPGHNALNQLDLRLGAALSAQMAAQQTIGWVSIDLAPKDGTIVLVNDTTEGGSKWAAAKWLAGEEWAGWVYDDEMLNDSAPLGPCPTLWLRGIE